MICVRHSQTTGPMECESASLPGRGSSPTPMLPGLTTLQLRTGRVERRDSGGPMHRRTRFMSAASKLIEAYSLRREKSAHCFERAGAVLGGKVGHDLRYFEPMPLYIERAKGGRKWDVDGNE